MDEYENSGMDPEVKRYFKKIMNSFFAGLFWMLSVATGGLFFGLATIKEGWKWYNTIFYVLAFLSLVFLLYYLYKVWKRDVPVE